jgi:hypothetical protein
MGQVVSLAASNRSMPAFRPNAFACVMVDTGPVDFTVYAGRILRMTATAITMLDENVDTGATREVSFEISDIIERLG